ncbi:MAG: GPW/gp25 family protein [Saprospiraceae bacterium]
MNKQDEFIGKGWSFPPSFNATTNSVQMVEGEEDIRQSLQILFGTRRGERILEQKYGCDLSLSIFQNITTTEQTVLLRKLRYAIINFESRIVLNDLSLDLTQLIDGILHIQLDFTIDHINSRRNIVFPFFIKEGTLIPKI